MKQEVREKHGAVALDTIVGLAVFPDADRYIEFVMAAQAQVYPGDPTYLFTALSKVWPIEIRFDDRSQDALRNSWPRHGGGIATIKFLLTYLAVEKRWLSAV